MRVAVLGRTRMLVLAARALDSHDHEVALVATAPAAGGYTATADDFRALADELECPFLDDPDLAAPDTVSQLSASGAEVAISVNWPTIVPRGVLTVFPHGVLNAHAGDLPRQRGNATVNWAILSGESEVVLTVHRMDEGLDTGPVLKKRRFPLGPSTYVGEVYAFCEQAVPELFVEVVDGLAEGTLSPVPQPEAPEGHLRCLPRSPEDGWVDWSQDADALARLVRASAEPFAGAFTMLRGGRLTIWRAHAEELPFEHLGVPGQVVEVRSDAGEVAVLTGSGMLVLERVESAAAGPAPAAELVRSTRLRLGIHAPALIAELRERVERLERRLGPEPPIADG